MSRSKQPKRIKAWVNEYGATDYVAHHSRLLAQCGANPSALRAAVPVIELRRGEVVVDVEALVEEFEANHHRNNIAVPYLTLARLRAALKKVGVR